MPLCPSCRAPVESGAVCRSCRGSAGVLPEPAVRLTTKDYRILEDLLREPGLSPPLRAAIGVKLHRAQVVFPSAIPADTVTLGSRVSYRLDGMGVGARRLVAAGDEMTGDTVALSTPVGVGLLGLRAGDETLIRLNGGGSRRLAVVAVPYQPEHPLRSRPTPRGAGEAREKHSATVVPLRRKPRPFGPGDDPGPSAA